MTRRNDAVLRLFFTTKAERDTGLGFAMVHGMTQRHSADLEIESAVGKGTTVRLSLAAPSVAGPERGLPGTPPTLLPRLRILVVDDDPPLLRTLSETSGSDGHDVVTANGGQPGMSAPRCERTPSTFRAGRIRATVYGQVAVYYARVPAPEFVEALTNQLGHPSIMDSFVREAIAGPAEARLRRDPGARNTALDALHKGTSPDGKATFPKFHRGHFSPPY